MEHNPLFSIIVPVYNVEKYLVECLESIVNQTFNDYEVLLVDDGSTDSSGIICDEYAEKCERVKAFHKSNGGLSDARNYGIEKSGGEYLLFIDSDDFWNELCFLENIAALAKNDPEMIIFGYGEFNNNTLYPKMNFKGVAKYSYSRNDVILNNWMVSSACCKAIKSRIIKDKNIRFRIGVTSEDIEWTTHLLTECRDFVVYGKCVYSYRQQSASITHNITEQSITQLADNIMYSIDLNSDKDEGIFSFIAYQYITLLNLFTLFAFDNDEIYDAVFSLKWLLKYNYNKKVKWIYYANKIFGFKTMLFLLKTFLLIRKTTK